MAKILSVSGNQFPLTTGTAMNAAAFAIPTKKELMKAVGVSQAFKAIGSSQLCQTLSAAAVVAKAADESAVILKNESHVRKTINE